MPTITLRQASRLGNYAKPYVARILGSDPQYKFARSFVEPSDKKFGSTWTFEVTEDGLYEVCDRNSKGAKRVYWYCLGNGVLNECVSDEVAGEWLAALDGAKAVAEHEAVNKRAAAKAASAAERAKLIASDPIANAQAATELAADKARQFGIEKDTWLPYVRAALTFWSRIQGRALADDNTRASFEAMAQQIEFGKEFQALTGREFSLNLDEISYERIQGIDRAN